MCAESRDDAASAAGANDDWRPPTFDATVRRSSTIGGSQVLDCDLSRQQVPLPSMPDTYSFTMERIMTWRRPDKEVPIFIQFNGYPPHVDKMYQVSNNNVNNLTSDKNAHTIALTVVDICYAEPEETA